VASRILSVGSIEVIITVDRLQLFDPAIFSVLGFDPVKMQIVNAALVYGSTTKMISA